MVLIRSQVELEHLACLLAEVQCLEVHPEGIRCQGRLEEIELALVVEHGPPAGGRNVGLFGSVQAIWHRGIADHAEDAGKRLVGVRAFGDRVDVERCAGKAVGGPVGAGQHGGATHLLPIGVQGQLLIEGRRVGHDLVFTAVVYHLPAVDVFDDRAVAAGVGHREVQRCQAVLSGHVVRDDGEGLFLQSRDGFLHGGEVVQHILRPSRNGQAGFAVCTESGILGFHEP